MKRRFNYTDRKKIILDRVAIELQESGEVAKSFRADVRLNDMELPRGASVYLEAYHRTDMERWSYGTVVKRKLPEDISIDHLGHIENLLFRVKVVDESGKRGLILAEADRINPRRKGEKGLKERCILPVEFNKDLGRQIWRVSFDGDVPVLEFNGNHIPNIRHLAQTDYGFFFCVYPLVIKEVFTRIFLVDEITDLAEPEVNWHKDWLDFAHRFNSESIPEPVSREEDGFQDFITDIMKWIDGVVDGFCRSHPEKWREFIKQNERSNNQ